MTDHSSIQRTGIHPATSKAVAIVVVIMLNIVAMALTTAAATLNAFGSLSDRPQELTAIALAMAWCSICGIWWSRARWSSHARTLFAASGCAVIWWVLVVVLPEARNGPEHSATWAASFAVQLILTAIGATLVELATRKKDDPLNIRFSLAFLMMWTTAVASALGFARWFAAGVGWTHENFFASGYFDQLQAVAVSNSLMAVGLFVLTRLAGSGTARVLRLIAAIPLIATASTGVMYAIFGTSFGPPVLTYWCLVTAEGVFLAVTLLPLEFAASDEGLAYQSSAATSNGSSSAAC